VTGNEDATGEGSSDARRVVRTPRPLNMELPAELAVGSIVRHRTAEWLHAHGWPPDECDDVVTAVHEAVANVIDHAYGDDRSGIVRLTAQVRSLADGCAQAVVKVRDWGKWKPAPGIVGFRGHGLKMMNGLMEDVEITTDGQGTQVVLTGPVTAVAETRKRPPSTLGNGSVTVSARVHSPRLFTAVGRPWHEVGQKVAVTLGRSQDLCHRAQAAHEATTQTLQASESWLSRRTQRPRQLAGMSQPSGAPVPGPA
jgi:serine/threonine-protein kinase RsbW